MEVEGILGVAANVCGGGVWGRGARKAQDTGERKRERESQHASTNKLAS